MSPIAGICGYTRISFCASERRICLFVNTDVSLTESKLKKKKKSYRWRKTAPKWNAMPESENWGWNESSKELGRLLDCRRIPKQATSEHFRCMRLHRLATGGIQSKQPMRKHEQHSLRRGKIEEKGRGRGIHGGKRKRSSLYAINEMNGKAGTKRRSAMKWTSIQAIILSLKRSGTIWNHQQKILLQDTPLSCIALSRFQRSVSVHSDTSPN